MSTNPDRSGQFGRRSGPDAPPPVPFATKLLPGVSFVTACVKIGETIGRIKKTDAPDVHAAVRADSSDDRFAAVLSAIEAIASGKLKLHARPIVTGKKGQTYTAQETAGAIVAAFRFLHKHNPPQEERYRDRCKGETDRGLKIGRAGENPIGWTDATADNAAALKRASDEDIARARAAKSERSGPNAPTAKFLRRTGEGSEGTAAPQGEREGSRPTGGKRRAARSAAAAETAGSATPAERPAQGARRPARNAATKGATRPSRRGSREG